MSKIDGDFGASILMGLRSSLSVTDKTFEYEISEYQSGMSLK